MMVEMTDRKNFVARRGGPWRAAPADSRPKRADRSAAPCAAGWRYGPRQSAARRRPGKSRTGCSSRAPCQPGQRLGQIVQGNALALGLGRDPEGEVLDLTTGSSWRNRWGRGHKGADPALLGQHAALFQFGIGA